MTDIPRAGYVPAKLVRQARTQLGETQQQFADRIGACKRSVIRWEQKGRIVHYGTLAKIAWGKALDAIDAKRTRKRVAD